MTKTLINFVNFGLDFMKQKNHESSILMQKLE
jgi:hypothetical protein